MKKKIKVIFLCTLLILTIFSTVGTINLNKTSNQIPLIEKGQVYYKKSFADIAYSVEQTDDEEIIADGTSIPEEALRLTIVKTDKDGNEEWFKTYGEDNSHSYAAYDVEQTPDGDFVHAGSTTATLDGHEDCWLIKTDKNGTMIWNNTYGGVEDQVAYDVEVTQDGGYFVVGYTTDTNDGHPNVYLFKTDLDGNLQFEKNIGPDTTNYGFSGDQTPDGDYIVCGITDVSSDGKYDCWLIKIDENGTMIWDNTYGGLEDQVAYDVEVTQDGGYFVVGYTTDTNDGHPNVYLFKTDLDGNLQFEKNIGPDTTNYGFSGDQTPDGDYIVCGITDVSSDGKYDCWLIKIDENGTIIWDNTYGGPEDQVAYDVEVTHDEGYILAGYTNDTYNGEPDILLIKTNKNGDMEWTKNYGYQEDLKDFVKIEISGGLGITASIENILTENLTDVEWSISVNRILFGSVMYGKEKIGTISIIEPGKAEIIKSLIIGFGIVEIKILIQYRDLDDDGLANIIVIGILDIKLRD